MIILAIMLPVIYEYAIRKEEANSLKQARSFVEAYSWETSISISTNTIIDEQAGLDHKSFEARADASIDIGLNYLTLKGEEAKLYSFNIDKKYRNKPVYAHILMYNNQIIGGYLQNQITA